MKQMILWTIIITLCIAILLTNGCTEVDNNNQTIQDFCNLKHTNLISFTISGRCSYLADDNVIYTTNYRLVNGIWHEVSDLK